MKNMQLSYISELNKEYLLRKISERKTGFASVGIHGWVRGDKVTITHRPGYGNSWSPVFTGKVAETARGTELSGTIQTALFVRVFMAVWRCGVLAFLLLALWRIIFHHEPLSSAFIMLLIPLVMLVFSFALVRFGESLGKKSRAEIIRFIEGELHARAVDNDIS